MRTVATSQEDTLRAPRYDVHLRVEVANSTGDFINLSELSTADWVSSAEWAWDLDRPVPEARVKLRRDITGGISLAPLMDASTLNVNTTGGAGFALLDAGRELRIFTATVDPGVTPATSEMDFMFDGEIDEVNWGGSPVEIVARSKIMSRLNDQWVESSGSVYGSSGGTAVETVMQSILDDHTDLGVTLWTPDSPLFLVTTYSQEKMSVLSALTALVQLFGWDVREVWDDASTAWRLKLYEPNRTASSSDSSWEFGPDEYLDVNRLLISRADVRNAISVLYTSTSDAAQASVLLESTSSQDRWGRRWMEIEEGDESSIATSSQAAQMAQSALDDLEDPGAEQEIELPYWWPGELQDYLGFDANGIHYDADQYWGVYGIRHQLTQRRHRTQVSVRGKPAGQYLSWFAAGAGLTPETGATTDGGSPITGFLKVVVDVDAQTLGLYGSLEGPAGSFPATVDVYQGDPEGGVLQQVTVNASGDTFGPTGSGKTQTFAAFTDIALTKVGILSFWGKITDADANVEWIYTSGDLNNLPGGSVAVDDFTEKPTINLYYDDDVAEIVVTTPGGNLTFTGLSGGGSTTYQVNVDTLDASTGELPIADEATRSGYVVNYYGAVGSTGPQFRPFEGALHGKTGRIPSLAIDSQTEQSSAEVTEVLIDESDCFWGSVAAFNCDTWKNLREGVAIQINFKPNDTIMEVWLRRDGGCATNPSSSEPGWAGIYRGAVSFPTDSFSPFGEASTDSFVALHCSLNPQFSAASSGRVVLGPALFSNATAPEWGDWSNFPGALSSGIGAGTAYSEAVALSTFVSGDTVQFDLTTPGVDALTEAIQAGQSVQFGVYMESDLLDTEFIPTSTTTANNRTRFATDNSPTTAWHPQLSVALTQPTGSVILRHSDPGQLSTKIQVQKRKGGAPIPTDWIDYATTDAAAIATGVLSSDPVTVALVDKHRSFVSARLEYLLGTETFYSSPITSLGLDIGEIPDLTAQAIADSIWRSGVEVHGDADTRAIRVGFEVGVAATEPSRTAIQARNAIPPTSNQRKWTWGEINSAYSTDMPVQLEQNETAIFGILGYGTSSGGGSESRDLTIVKISRPPDETPTTGSTEASLISATVDVDDDDEGVITYTVDWEVSDGVNDDMELFMFMEVHGSGGIGTYADSTEETPAASTQEVFATSCAGGVINGQWSGNILLISSSGADINSIDLFWSTG